MQINEENGAWLETEEEFQVQSARRTLLTVPGDDVMNLDFGANILRFTSAVLDSQTEAEIAANVTTSIADVLPVSSIRSQKEGEMLDVVVNDGTGGGPSFSVSFSELGA